ncbi:hypothetical protein HPB49_002551 [Dermacentor silvarum]|uniref:Uncharacterized protein n=1 Tax=Dermacentor silvarum TaxID=543639 RepID=A0ACB8DTB7_DERSI|nr:hypothetical protein HPB49_002551 [Dermacentor silvarum]
MRYKGHRKWAEEGVGGSQIRHFRHNRVNHIYKNKDKLWQRLQQDSSSLSQKRIRTSKYENVDAALFRWFHEVRAQSIPVIENSMPRVGVVPELTTLHASLLKSRVAQVFNDESRHGTLTAKKANNTAG